MYEPHVAPPTVVAGKPSILREAVVVTINTDGTVDLKATDSRTGWTQMTVPGWYVPTAGDRVIVGDLQGDAQQPTILALSSAVKAIFATLRVSGNVGFFGQAPQAKPTVTGSRGANAALASLLASLSALGLVTDSTTA